MLSTAHNTSDEVAMKRFKESRDKQPLPCPSCVSDYNCYVHGRCRISRPIHQLLQSHTETPLKWWKKIFWHMIDI